MDNVSLTVTEFTNPLIEDSASHGDQAEEYVSHPNVNEYYEESDVDEDEDRDDNNDDDNIPFTFKEWQVSCLKRGTLNLKKS